jgi:DNA-binding NarL/FixJ family response regulator
MDFTAHRLPRLLANGQELGAENAELCRETRHLRSEVRRILAECRQLQQNLVQTIGGRRPGPVPAFRRLEVAGGHVAAAAPVVSSDSAEALTERELEVLRCIAEGNSTKQVAAILKISFKTAACHRYRLMRKLGIHDTVSLVRHAVRNGIVAA